MATGRTGEAPAVTVSREQESTASAEELRSTYEGLRDEFVRLAWETSRLWSVYERRQAGPESEAAYAAYAEALQREKSCGDAMSAAYEAWSRVEDTATPDE